VEDVVRTVLALVFVGLGLLAPAASSATGLPDGRAIAVETSLSPDVHLFAEPVVARVRVIVDSTQFDPDRVRVRTDFAPYELVAQTDRSRRTIGDVVELQYAATLRCLEADCLAPRYQTVLGEQEGGRPERYTYRFRPVAILYARPSGRSELLLQRPFPALEVVSRVNTAQLQAVDPLAQPGLGDPSAASAYTASIEPPAPTYRLPPWALAALPLALAVLLLLFPAWLVGRAVVARWRATRRPRELSPADRALLLVEWSSRQSDGEEDRRRALEALADVLDEHGAEPLAHAARTSAWEEGVPDGARARELAGEARTVLGGHDWSR
jgi:hypothetical protein